MLRMEPVHLIKDTHLSHLIIWHPEVLNYLTLIPSKGLLILGLVTLLTAAGVD